MGDKGDNALYMEQYKLLFWDNLLKSDVYRKIGSYKQKPYTVILTEKRLI